MPVALFGSFSPPIIKNSTEQYYFVAQQWHVFQSINGRVVQADLQVPWIHFGSFYCTWMPYSEFFNAVANYIVYGVEHVKATINDVPCALMKDKLQRVCA